MENLPTQDFGVTENSFLVEKFEADKNPFEKKIKLKISAPKILSYICSCLSKFCRKLARVRRKIKIVCPAYFLTHDAAIVHNQSERLCYVYT